MERRSMVSALQPFVQTKIEPCTLKLKFCLEIARVPLKMAARISYICLRSWRYNKAVFFIENTCTFYWELILPLSKILFFLKRENFIIWVKTVCFWVCSPNFLSPLYCLVINPSKWRAICFPLFKPVIN